MPLRTRKDRITRLHISNVRGIRELTVDFSGISVLIGDNGSGKSTILECLDLMRQASLPVSYVRDVLNRHGGLEGLIRHGQRSFTLAIRIQGAQPATLVYAFEIGYVAGKQIIMMESLEEQTGVRAKPRAIFLRGNDFFEVSGNGSMERSKLPEDSSQKLLGPQFGIDAAPAFRRLKKALEGIDFQVPFETRARWQQAESEVRGPRWPATVEEVDSLARYGTNLAACYLELKNTGNQRWSEILERLRLGLGDDFADLQTKPVGRGKIELRALFHSAPDYPVPSEFLSDGQLAYLCFVALVEMNRGRSILAFDEPEVHLHPGLLSRVTWLLEEMSKDAPVIIATHSDKLLDTLSEPADSVVLCELDSERSVSVLRPQPDKLKEWLEDYRGLGEIRSAGYEKHVFPSVDG